MAIAANITDDGWIWYEPERVDRPDPGLFDPGAWRGRAEVAPADRGRGAAWFIDISPGRRYVLRSYRRGGLVGRFVRDRYLFTGKARTRPAQEIHLLAHLESLGLPAPRPAAARYRRRGIIYRADILTERLPDTRPLSAILQAEPISAETWQAIGHCIRRFHEHGVCHADLNAHNILLDGAGRVFLIDFDRGELRRPGRWRQANLDRLARSFAKLAGQGRLHHDEADWQSLVSGYEEPAP